VPALPDGSRDLAESGEMKPQRGDMGSDSSLQGMVARAFAEVTTPKEQQEVTQLLTSAAFGSEKDFIMSIEAIGEEQFFRDMRTELGLKYRHSVLLVKFYREHVATKY